MQMEAEPSEEKMLACSVQVRFSPHGVIDLVDVIGINLQAQMV